MYLQCEAICVIFRPVEYANNAKMSVSDELGSERVGAGEQYHTTAYMFFVN